MNKKVFALVATLMIGIVIGVAATGLVYAISSSEDGSLFVPQEGPHMMAAHHSAGMSDCVENASMPEDCPNFDSHHGDEDFDHSSHHGGMH